MKNIKDLIENAEELEIENFDLNFEELELTYLPRKILKKAAEVKARVEPFTYKTPADRYSNRISSVTLGASKEDGGSRDRVLKIGGETAPAFYYFQDYRMDKPVISHDVFDMPISLPGHVKEYFVDAMENPVDWAKLRVKKFNADMITLHLVSSDPTVKDTPIKESLKVIEEVLQAVKVPLIIGGSGNPKKDPELLEKAAELCAGEKVVLSSVDPDMDYKRVAKAAVEHNHSLMALISMNPDEMRRLSKNLMKEGVTREGLIMDLFTGGVGYGIEYSISAMERCRLAGLKGDEFLGLPMASATSNAWSAREAWMHKDEIGPREWRGPLWESTTAIIALLCGADLFMMLHPLSIEITKSVIDSLYEPKKLDVVEDKYPEWVRM